MSDESHALRAGSNGKSVQPFVTRREHWIIRCSYMLLFVSLVRVHTEQFVP